MNEKSSPQLPLYLYVSTKVQGWQDQVLQFLHQNQIDANTLSSAYSGETDLHVFGLKGSSKHRYQLMSYPAGSAGAPEWVKITKQLLRTGYSYLFGISGADVWILSRE